MCMGVENGNEQNIMFAIAGGANISGTEKPSFDHDKKERARGCS